jgi:hypothetical protein
MNIIKQREQKIMDGEDESNYEAFSTRDLIPEKIAADPWKNVTTAGVIDEG